MESEGLTASVFTGIPVGLLVSRHLFFFNQKFNVNSVVKVDVGL